MATQLIIPRQLDANGDAASGAKALVYETGTTTPVTVYTDTALSVAHASPIVADSAGYFAQAFYGGSTALKVVVTDSSDATLVTYDPVPLVSLSGSAASDVTFAPTTEIPQTDVQAAIVAVEAKTIQTADLADDAVTRAKIADAAMSGDDSTLITGTAGTSGNLASWNADGDLVDSGAAAAPVYDYSSNSAGTTYSLLGSWDYASDKVPSEFKLVISTLSMPATAQDITLELLDATGTANASLNGSWSRFNFGTVQVSGVDMILDTSTDSDAQYSGVFEFYLNRDPDASSNSVSYNFHYHLWDYRGAGKVLNGGGRTGITTAGFQGFSFTSSSTNFLLDGYYIWRPSDVITHT